VLFKTEVVKLKPSLTPSVLEMPFTIRRDLLEESSAVFSDCGAYRYRLDRKWDDRLPPLAFGMLNPSTADDVRNDATIERCERRARALGFGSLIVWNLFAYRTVSPKALKAHHSPIGPENDGFIREILLEIKLRNGVVIAGWGSHGIFQGRHKRALELAKLLNIDLHCLGVTNSGQPRHPLYVSYQCEARKWEPIFEGTGEYPAAFEPHASLII
jgi:hypothetical protein